MHHSHLAKKKEKREEMEGWGRGWGEEEKGKKEGEREAGRTRKKKEREETYSEKTGFYETYSSSIIEQEKKQKNSKLFPHLYPNKSSLFIKRITTAFKELIFK